MLILLKISFAANTVNRTGKILKPLKFMTGTVIPTVSKCKGQATVA